MERVRAGAAEVHALEGPTTPRPTVWLIESTTTAIVLGSTQDATAVDAEQASAQGFDVVRRRSGGGAVLVVPGELLWVDVFVPRGDALWDDDVGRATHWLGGLWSSALTAVGMSSVVHRGPMAADDLARTVCFVGRGPGEVFTTDHDPEGTSAKIVGISQRRTRAQARFQCACLIRWNPDPWGPLLPSLRPDDLGRIAQAGRGVGHAATAVLDAFFEGLTER